MISIRVAAGAFNVILAIAFAQSEIAPSQVCIVLIIGALSYGLSLVLFVKSLRLIGSARTSSYFAVGPFVGMFASVILLGDRPAAYQWVAAGIMIAGVWILYREDHEHLHVHDLITHSHLHSHDEHHRHQHEA